MSGLVKGISNSQQTIDTIHPIGSTYLEVPGGVLSSNILLNFDGSPCAYADLGFATQNDYDAAKLSASFKGTTWRMAIRQGDVLRQSGQRTDGNGKTIGAGNSTGLQQDHQMQGHRHNLQRYINGVVGSSGYILGGTIQDGTVISDPITDGTNGTPLTGVETRMVNTTGRYWRRTL